MKRPLIRKGRLVANPLAGLDMSKLSGGQTAKYKALLDKGIDGKRINNSDLAAISAMRKAVQPTTTRQMLDALMQATS